MSFLINDCILLSILGILRVMKRSELLISVLLVPIDALATLGAFLLAYWLRAQGEVIYLLPLGEYLSFILSLLPLILVVFALEGLYNVRSARQGVDELAGIFVATSLGGLLVTAAIFLTNTELGSRIVLLYAYLLSLLLVFAGRWTVRSLQKFLYRFNIGVHRVIVIGTNGHAEHLKAELTTNSRLGYVYLGHIDPSASNHAALHVGKHLGSLTELERVIDHYHPDALIVAEPNLSQRQSLDLIALAKRCRIDLTLTPNVVGLQTANVRYLSLAGIPMLEVQRTPLEGWGRVAKRIFDVVGSLALIILTSPIMLAVALAVLLTSDGPVIYRNRRVGQDGVEFDTLKFRSMNIEHSTGSQYGGEQALKYEQELISKSNSRKGALYKVANDPRLTSIGNFLRRSSLDEFPQFFNVLGGTMSLVGPRPHQPREVARYEDWQQQLFTVKPGITGMAQISGRSDLDFDEEAKLDISYIENWSFWSDLRILLRTPLALLRSRQRKAA